jgi:hypothetical protein
MERNYKNKDRKYWNGEQNNDIRNELNKKLILWKDKQDQQAFSQTNEEKIQI